MSAIEGVIGEWNQGLPELLDRVGGESIGAHPTLEVDILLVEDVLVLLSHRLSK